VQYYGIEIDRDHVVAAGLDGAVICECTLPSDLLAESGLTNEFYFAVLRLHHLFQEMKLKRALPSPACVDTALEDWVRQQTASNQRLLQVEAVFKKCQMNADMLRVLEPAIAAPIIGVTSKELKAFQRAFMEAFPGMVLPIVMMTDPRTAQAHESFLVPFE
jgi:hypothetical protein